MLKNSLNGVFSVYKPTGLNSRKAVDFVQLALSKELVGDERRLKRKEMIKIGHGGTLVSRKKKKGVYLFIYYI